MAPGLFSWIAHRRHDFCSPLSSATVDRVIELLELPPESQVLDIGCGKAEALVRIAQRYRAHCVGVDLSERFIAEARERSQRLTSGTVTLHCRRAAEFAAPAAAYNLALCIGSAGAYGTYREMLRSLAAYVRPGGELLVGEPYWKQTPHPDYLGMLGVAETFYQDHAGNVAAAVEAGLVPLYASVSSEDDWDHYEGLYLCSIERYAAEHPDDPDQPAMLERIRTWRDAYLRWGRQTLGFGLYLLRKPGGRFSEPSI